MIEPTDEMGTALLAALPPDARWGWKAEDAKAWLVSVLALVERDYDTRYQRLLAANRKLVVRLEPLERIEVERDRALGHLEDTRRELARRP